MTPDRALEIIAACGADPCRWPADERAALAMLVDDAAVAAALREAGDLDALLAGWAADVVPAPAIDPATLIPLPPATGLRRWIGGGVAATALAAGLALLMVLPASPPATRIAVIPATTAPSAAVESLASSDAAAFATVFTPTADEENLI